MLAKWLVATYSPHFAGKGGKIAGPSETWVSGRCQPHFESARELQEKARVSSFTKLDRLLCIFVSDPWRPTQTHSPLAVGCPRPLAPWSDTSPPSSPPRSAGGEGRTPRPSCRATPGPSRGGSVGPPGTVSPPRPSPSWSAGGSGSAGAGASAGGNGCPPGSFHWCSHSV